MSLSVKLEAFEGPLDLLLHLIEKNKINIYDIPILEITQQYLEYVNLMESQDLNLISNFLLMASTLLDIKSRMLLPKQDDENDEEDDPRQDLVERLLEYKLYKYISSELKDRKSDANKSIFKDATIPGEVSGYEQPVDMEKLIGDLTLGKLNDIFNEVMRRQINKVDKIRSNFGTIEKDEVSLTDKIDEIIHYASRYKKISFKKLLLKQSSKMNIIVSFLAILELIKLGRINIVQEFIFDDITIIEA